VICSIEILLCIYLHCEFCMCSYNQLALLCEHDEGSVKNFFALIK